MIKWVVLGVWCTGAVVAIAGVVLGDARVAWRLAPSLVVVGVLLLLFFRMTGWVHAWQVGRDDPNVAHPIVHTFDATGLQVATHSARVHLSWDGVHKVRETENMFLTYYSPRYAYFLPKRVVGSAANVDNLRDRIRAWLPGDTAFEGET